MTLSGWRYRLPKSGGSGRNDLQARYAALEAQHAKLKGRNKALGADLATLRNV